ncbi:hypothetical protein G7Y89_g13601 [Cudoniella acicularis]|uniref:DUF6594 domain-containing protein n=1 Tax=Cudoniella acicularis TaxID=354080 RepID=A0A8H4VW97_9HELO|nr:hypothetical protein G7Y89_g13601 [Cudoniella acicularis]
MTTSYSAPAVEVIQEVSEDERGGLRGKDEDSVTEVTHCPARSPRGTNMPSNRANTSKERDRSRRYHKSTPSGSGKHPARTRTKNTSTKRASIAAVKADAEDSHHRRRRRSRSSRSGDSSSEDEDDTPIQDHKAVLAARARLTSPSTISGMTSLTNTTNKSSSSSGSNSTVTQASVTKRTTFVKKAVVENGPMSPAVPDAPNVFEYLDPDGSVIGKNETESESSEDEPHQTAAPPWTPRPTLQLENGPVETALPPRMLPEHASMSSSASSSFREDDNSSEPPHENDTDRSTSPERSVQGQEEEEEEEEDNEPEPAPAPAPEVPAAPAAPTAPNDDTSTKIASQMAAAHQRQNLYGSMHPFGTPNMQRGPAVLPHIPPTVLSSRHQQHQIKQYPLPRAEKLPVTGYELLASRLSSRTTPSELERGEKIKPIYRKFESLNHRLLLHLQDELVELEEQLHRLDHTDTQSRRTAREIMPASRRAAAAIGGELQWHKTDVLGKIGFKLAQYNQALASFNSTRSLSAPGPEDISSYRSYLQTAQPIAEAETHFLDPDDDLVSIYSDHVSSSSSDATSYQSSALSYPPSTTASQPKTVEFNPETVAKTQPALSTFAAAIAVAVLIPFLTFFLIPGFLGRITVMSLIAAGVVFGAVQVGVVEKTTLAGNEGLMCAGIYGGVMVVVAGIMPA